MPANCAPQEPSPIRSGVVLHHCQARPADGIGQHRVDDERIGWVAPDRHAGRDAYLDDLLLRCDPSLQVGQHSRQRSFGRRRDLGRRIGRPDGPAGRGARTPPAPRSASPPRRQQQHGDDEESQEGHGLVALDGEDCSSDDPSSGQPDFKGPSPDLPSPDKPSPDKPSPDKPSPDRHSGDGSVRAMSVAATEQTELPLDRVDVDEAQLSRLESDLTQVAEVLAELDRIPPAAAGSDTAAQVRDLLAGRFAVPSPAPDQSVVSGHSERSGISDLAGDSHQVIVDQSDPFAEHPTGRA